MWVAYALIVIGIVEFWASVTVEIIISFQAPNGYAIKLYANEFDIPACVEDDFGFCAECSNDGSYLEVCSTVSSSLVCMYNQF